MCFRKPFEYKGQAYRVVNMKDKKLFEHQTYYFFELLVLLGGFFLILLFSYSLNMQFIILIFILMCYTVMGFIHHQINHYFNIKVVLEYILVSALVLCAFLLLNIGRLG